MRGTNDMYKKTERMIFEYFQANRNIEAKSATIELLEAQVDELDRRMRETDISIPEQSFESSWGDAMGSGGNNGGYSDKAVDRIIGMMESELWDKIELINKLETDIRYINTRGVEFKHHYDNLPTCDMKLLRYKYGEKMTDFDVGFEMCISQSQVSKIKRKLIMDVMDWNILQLKDDCTRGR